MVEPAISLLGSTQERSSSSSWRRRRNGRIERARGLSPGHVKILFVRVIGNLTNATVLAVIYP